MNQQDQLLKELVKKDMELEKQYLKLPLITEGYEIGQLVGISWTNCNRKYWAIARILIVNPKSIRIELTNIKPEGYEVGQSWAISIKKFTKFNRIFQPNAELIQEINTSFSSIKKIVDERINNFWKEKISKAEEEQKKQGVYKTGETWLIDEKGFNKVKDNYEVSV